MGVDSKFELHPAVGFETHQYSPEQTVNRTKEELENLGLPIENSEKLLEIILESGKGMAGKILDLVRCDPALCKIVRNGIVASNYNHNTGEGTINIYTESMYREAIPKSLRLHKKDHRS